MLNDRDIAKEPLEASEFHKKLGYKHDCPTCHYLLGYKEKTYGILPRCLRRTVLYEVCTSYCMFCGQRINWSKVVLGN